MNRGKDLILVTGATGKQGGSVARELLANGHKVLAMTLKPTTVLQMIAVRDIGKYGLRAFERHAELNRREIDIAGDQHTSPETAQILSRAIGREIRFVPVPIEEVGKASADYAAMLEWFDRVGY